MEFLEKSQRKNGKRQTAFFQCCQSNLKNNISQADFACIIFRILTLSASILLMTVAQPKRIYCMRNVNKRPYFVYLELLQQNS